jgi:hypothetical protein
MSLGDSPDPKTGELVTARTAFAGVRLTALLRWQHLPSNRRAPELSMHLAIMTHGLIRVRMEA